VERGAALDGLEVEVMCLLPFYFYSCGKDSKTVLGGRIVGADEMDGPTHHISEALNVARLTASLSHPQPYCHRHLGS
jgi:hypothetical protein